MSAKYQYYQKTSCPFCAKDFFQKSNMEKHLKNAKCTVLPTLSQFEIYTLMCQWGQDTKPNNKPKVSTSSEQHKANPISQASATHISVERMRNLIEKYDTPDGKSKLGLLLSDYIRDILCNKDHPENHVVKYVRLKPPTFHVVSLGENGDTLTSIKGIKDTCDVLTTPLFQLLKAKLKECLRCIKHDPTFDFDIYEEGIKNLKSDLNEGIVKKVIGNILRYDIVNDHYMKFVRD